MARDILTILAFDINIEQLFNIAQNIYYYYYFYLKAEIISKLIIMKHFDNVIL